MRIYNQTILKKLTIIICLTLLSNMSKAQLFRSKIDLNDYHNYINNLGSLYVNDDYKRQGVKEVIIKIVAPKTNQLSSRWIYKFNKNGVSYFYQSLNKKGNVYLTKNYHLIDTLRYDKEERAYKKDTFTTVNIFNTNNKIIEMQYFNAYKKMYWSYKYTYNDKNKMASSTSFNKKGKQFFRNEFDYYDNGSRKETRHYNKKTKLDKIYNYACEPIGVIEKKVTQQNICKKRNYNPDSSYFEIFEGYDNKGNNSRRIVKYSKDSLELEQTYYSNNDKETSRYVSEYNNRKVVTFKRFYKGKLKKIYHYTYKPNGLSESYKETNAKGKVKSNMIYEYSYF